MATIQKYKDITGREWIDVSEKLPEDDSECWVFIDTNGVKSKCFIGVSWYDEDHWWYGDQGTWWFKQHMVTHWMYRDKMPEPPEEK